MSIISNTKSQGSSLSFGFRDSLGPQLGWDAPLDENLLHLCPAHSGEVGGFGEGEILSPIAIDGKLDPGVGTRAEQVPQSVADDLVLAVLARPPAATKPWSSGA